MATKNPYFFLTLQKYTATNTSSVTKKNPHSCCNLLIGTFVKGLNCQRATCLCIMLRQKVVFIEWVPIDSNCIVHCQNIYISHFISYKKIIPLVNSKVLNFTVEFERFIPYGKYNIQSCYYEEKRARNRTNTLPKWFEKVLTVETMKKILVSPKPRPDKLHLNQNWKLRQ